MSLLSNILGVLARVDVVDITESFVDLYNAAASVLNEDDQDKLKSALAARRLDNDDGHARLQALLAEAQKG